MFDHVGHAIVIPALIEIITSSFPMDKQIWMPNFRPVIDREVSGAEHDNNLTIIQHRWTFDSLKGNHGMFLVSAHFE